MSTARGSRIAKLLQSLQSDYEQLQGRLQALTRDQRQSAKTAARDSSPSPIPELEGLDDDEEVSEERERGKVRLEPKPKTIKRWQKLRGVGVPNIARNAANIYRNWLKVQPILAEQERKVDAYLEANPRFRESLRNLDDNQMAAETRKIGLDKPPSNLSAPYVTALNKQLKELLETANLFFALGITDELLEEDQDIDVAQVLLETDKLLSAEHAKLLREIGPRKFLRRYKNLRRGMLCDALDTLAAQFEALVDALEPLVSYAPYSSGKSVPLVKAYQRAEEQFGQVDEIQGVLCREQVGGEKLEKVKQATRTVLDEVQREARERIRREAFADAPEPAADAPENVMQVKRRGKVVG